MFNPNKIPFMEQFKVKMPWLGLYTDEEIFDLWATYDILHKQLRAMEQRTGAAFVDPELHFGPYQRAQHLLAECQRREALRGNALQPAPTDD